MHHMPFPIKSTLRTRQISASIFCSSARLQSYVPALDVVASTTEQRKAVLRRYTGALASRSCRWSPTHSVQLVAASSTHFHFYPFQLYSFQKPQLSMLMRAQVPSDENPTPIHVCFRFLPFHLSSAPRPAPDQTDPALDVLYNLHRSHPTPACERHHRRKPPS